MGRLLFWAACIAFGCAVGILGGPLVGAALGALFRGDSPPSDGYPGFFVGLWAGPLAGCALGALAAWRLSREPPADEIRPA